MKKKFLITSAVLSFSAFLSVGALVGLSGAKGVKTNATAQSYSCSELVLHDEAGWCFRTLWTNNYGFSSGYTIDDFASFVSDYYGTESKDSWDKQGSTRSWHRYENGFNLCAGGTSGIYTFLFPEWVEYFSIEAQNNDNTRSFNYLNNLTSAEQYEGLVGSGYGKTVDLYAKANDKGYSWVSVSAESASTTDFDTTVTVTLKSDASTTISSESVQTSKYSHLSDPVLSGYTFDGWYSDASLTTPYSGLVLDKSVLYAKMTEDEHVYTIKINNGEPITLNAQPKETYKAQYMAQVNLTRGDSISFQVDGESIVPINDSMATNNINSLDFKVLDSANNAPVWLKLLQIGETLQYNSWIGGRTHDYYYKINHSVNGLIPMEKNPNDSNEYIATGVAVTPTWGQQLYSDGVHNFLWDSASDGSWKVGNNNNTIAVSGGVFDIYYKVNENVCYYQYSSSASLKIRVGEGSCQNLIDDSTHAPEGYSKQYMFTTTVAAGQVISFFDYDNSTYYSLPAVADSTAFNNVNTSTNAVLTGSGESTVDIYLKKASAGGWEYFVGGRTANYYLVVGDTYVPMTANPHTEGQFMATSVAIAKDALISLYATAGYNGSYDEASTGSWSYEDSKIKCGTAGTYNVYYTPSESNVIYFGNPSAADVEATTYAELFHSSLKEGQDPVCKEYGETDVEALQNSWEELADLYGDLGKEAKDILHDASTAGAAEVNEFARDYDWIIAHYSTELASHGGNFVGRDVAKAAITSYNTYNTINFESKTFIIVAVALISVTAIGVTTLIKVRKER